MIIGGCGLCEWGYFFLVNMGVNVHQNKVMVEFGECQCGGQGMWLIRGDEVPDD